MESWEPSYKRSRRNTLGVGDVTMEARGAVMWGRGRSQGMLGPLEAEKSKEMDSPEPSEGTGLTNTLILAL